MKPMLIRIIPMRGPAMHNGLQYVYRWRCRVCNSDSDRLCFYWDAAASFAVQHLFENHTVRNANDPTASPRTPEWFFGSLQN